MKLVAQLRRRWWLPALALVVAGSAGFWHFMAVSSRGEGQDADATSSQTSYRPVACFGTVDLEDQIRNLNPTVPGLVAEVLVREDDHVPAGAALLRLDDKIARDQVDSARAALEMAQNNLKRALTLPEQHRLNIDQAQKAVANAQAQRDNAQQALEHKQKQELLPSNELFLAIDKLGVADEYLRARQHDLARLRISDPTTELRAAEIAVDQADLNLRQAQHHLAAYVVTAPTSGTVLQVNVQPGDTFPVAGRPAAIEFGPDSPRVIRAEVEQAFASLIVEGLRTKIEDDTHAAGAWTGRVKHVSDRFTRKRPSVTEPLQNSDVRVMACLIELDPGQPRLRLNQRVLVTIQVPLRTLGPRIQSEATWARIIPPPGIGF